MPDMVISQPIVNTMCKYMYNFHFGYLSRLYIRHFKTFIRVISVWVTFTFTKVIFSPDIVLYAVVHLLLLD